MIVYCIRKRGTEDFFPSVNGRGQTHLEFVHFMKKPPRIWYKKRAAKGWLTTYCKGPLVKDMRTETDEFGHSYEYAVGYLPNPSPQRNPADYEIVPMSLHEYKESV